MQVTTRGFGNRPIGSAKSFFFFFRFFLLPVSYAQTFRSPAAVLHGWVVYSKVDLPSTRPLFFALVALQPRKSSRVHHLCGNNVSNGDYVSLTGALVVQDIVE